MKDWIDEYWEKVALPALMEFGTIPNVSPMFDPEWSAHGHMDRAALNIQTWAKSRGIPGLQAEVVRLDGLTPVVFLDIPGTEASTDPVLFYGHYDKQPAMEGRWRAGLDPWKPVREGDLLYGRGLADDGYAPFLVLGAVEALRAAGATYPRVTMIVEGSEESGSVHLPPYLDHLAARIGTPRVIVSLDNVVRDAEFLWLTLSLRGIIEGVLTIETSESMHSGHATGVIPPATRILRALLDRVDNATTGDIVNEVINPPITDTMAAYCATIARDADNDYAASYAFPPGLRPVADSAEELARLNLWHAGMVVTGVDGIPDTVRAGTVMHGKVSVKLSIRIPPTVDPVAASAELKHLLEKDPPYQAHVSYTSLKDSWGWCAVPMQDALKHVVWEAAREAFGAEPRMTGTGGNVPFVGMMAKRYPNTDQLLTGVLTNGSNAHAPNESLAIPIAKKVTEFVARLMSKSVV